MEIISPAGLQSSIAKSGWNNPNSSICHLVSMTWICWFGFVGGRKMVCKFVSLVMVCMRDAMIAMISSGWRRCWVIVGVGSCVNEALDSGGVEAGVSWEGVEDGFLEGALFRTLTGGAGGTEYIWLFSSTSPCWRRADSPVGQRTTPVSVLLEWVCRARRGGLIGGWGGRGVSPSVGIVEIRETRWTWERDPMPSSYQSVKPSTLGLRTLQRS